MSEFLLSLAQVITEILIDGSIGYIGSKYKQHKLQQMFEEKIFNVFVSSLANIPHNDVVLDDVDPSLLLGDSIFILEIKKLIDPVENISEEILLERWISLFGEKSITFARIIIGGFVNSIRQELLKTKEFREIIFPKEQLTGINELTAKLNENTAILRRIDTNNSLQIHSDLIEVRWNERLASNKRLIDNNHTNAALELLEEAQKELEKEEVPPKLKSQLYNLIGNCQLQIGKPDLARVSYSKAIVLDDDNPDYYANISLAELHCDLVVDAKDHANKSMELEQNGIARSVLLQIASRGKSCDDLESLIDSSYFSEAPYVFTLAAIFMRCKEYSRAEEFIKKYLELKPNDIQANLLHSQILLDKYSSDKWSTSMDRAINGEIWVETNEEALTSITKTLQLIDGGDNKNLLIEAKSTEALVYLQAGKVDKAKQLIDIVLQQNSKNKILLHNRIVICIYLDEMDLAYQLLQDLSEEYIKSPAFYSMAVRVFLAKHEYEKAIDILDAVKDKVKSEPNYYIMKAWVNIESCNEEGVEKVRREISETDEISLSEQLQILASISYIKNNKKEAIEYLDSSLQNVKDQINRNRIYCRLSHLYFEDNNYFKVVETLELSEVSISSDPYLLRIYIVSLFFQKEYKKAFDYITISHQNEYFDPIVLDIESRLYELLGDYQKCLDIEKRLMDYSKDKSSNLSQIIGFHYRLGNYDEILKIIDSIKKEQNSDPILLIQCAHFLNLLGDNERSLEFALNAYFNGSDSPSIQLGFFSIFLSLDDDYCLDVEVVGLSTAVLLGRDGEEIWVKIVKEHNPNIRENEYSIDNPLIKKLLGHRVGESILFRHGDFEENQYLIKEILSIYVYVFREIGKNFSLNFPENQSLQKVKFDPDNPFEFLLMTAKNSIVQSKVLAVYDFGELTIERFSEVFHQNYCEFELLLQLDSTHKKFSSDGSIEQRRIDTISLSSAQSITITLSSLLTLGRLNLLDKLPSAFSNIFIHQKVNENLLLLRDKLKSTSTKVSGNIGYFEGGFYFNDIPKEFSLNNIYFIESLIEFIKTNCEFVPVEIEFVDQLRDPGIENEGLIFPGFESISSMIVAKQKRSVLYSDEIVLRRIAYQKFDVPGFWTQTLLLYLFNQGKISNEEYLSSIKFLLSHNYYYTYTNGFMIIDELRRNDFILNNDIQLLLSPIRDKSTILVTAISIARKVIEEIWSLQISISKKCNIMDGILYNLISQRQDEYVISALIFEIQKGLSLTPQLKSQIIMNISIFMKTVDKLKRSRVFNC